MALQVKMWGRGHCYTMCFLLIHSSKKGIFEIGITAAGSPFVPLDSCSILVCVFLCL